MPFYFRYAAFSRPTAFSDALLGPSIKFPNRADLLVLKGLLADGNVTPVLDGTYPLNATPEAMEHVGDGHARGTVVIIV